MDQVWILNSVTEGTAPTDAARLINSTLFKRLESFEEGRSSMTTRVVRKQRCIIGTDFSDFGAGARKPCH